MADVPAIPGPLILTYTLPDEWREVNGGFALEIQNVPRGIPVSNIELGDAWLPLPRGLSVGKLQHKFQGGSLLLILEGSGPPPAGGLVRVMAPAARPISERIPR